MYGKPSKKKFVTRSASLRTRVIRLPVCLLVKNPMDNLPSAANTSCFISRTVSATTCAINTPCTSVTPRCKILATIIAATRIRRASVYSPAIPIFPRIASFLLSTQSNNTVPLKYGHKRFINAEKI